MEEIKKDPGLYFAFSQIPNGEETKYVWIKRQGGNYGHFEIPTLFYRLKTAEEIQQDKIKISEIKNDTIVAEFGNMDYLSNFPISLHIYFDYTLQERSISKKKIRINASEDMGSKKYDYVKINIIRNSNQLQLGGYYKKYLKYKSKYVKV